MQAYLKFVLDSNEMFQVGNVGKASNPIRKAVCSLLACLPNNSGYGYKYFSKSSGVFNLNTKMHQNNKDEYSNPYPDFDAENGHGILDIHSKKLDAVLVGKIQDAVNQFTETVNTQGERTSDYSVYTGTAGVALLNLLLSQRFNDSKALAKAEDLLRRAPTKVHKSRVTFLMESGPVAVNAVVAHYLGKAADAKKNVSRLVSVLDDVIAANPEMPDECLYGRAGYLYSLLFVKKHLGPQSIDPAAIKKDVQSEKWTNTNPLNEKNKMWEFDNYTKAVVGAMITSGKSRSSLLRSKTPLVYQWHGKNYYGGAHGVAGILYLLLQVVSAVLMSGRARASDYRSKVPLVFEWYEENYYGAAHGVAGILYMLFQSGVLSAEDKSQLIKPTLDDLLAQRLPSGNFPSSQGSRSDRLVQWCHGAPGFAELLTTAYKEFGEERYRSIALECGDLVWQRGLCTKGYSICHGVSGNAYTFLQLYQLTGDIKHLYRAGCFADWCLTLPKHQQLQPDRPYSLFEGLAGVAYYLADIRNPSQAGFPAYTLQL